jgi:hypothetical protein
LRRITNYIKQNFKILLIVWILGGILGGFFWKYSLNSWLTYVSRIPNVSFWNGALLGLIPGFGYLCIPIAGITYIIMLFLI